MSRPIRDKPPLTSRADSEIPERRKCDDADLYALVLSQAMENYEQALVWSKPEAGFDYHVISLNRIAHAEAQIAVLEIFNCGQVGGFDKGQRDRTLKGRLAWLKTHRRATASTDPSPTEEPKL